MAYYLFAGTVIALLGFRRAIFAAKSPGQPTILNNYALKAYLTSGFFAGFVYWMVLAAGLARVAQDRGPSRAGDGATIGVPPPAKPGKAGRGSSSKTAQSLAPATRKSLAGRAPCRMADDAACAERAQMTDGAQSASPHQPIDRHQAAAVAAVAVQKRGSRCRNAGDIRAIDQAFASRCSRESCPETIVRR